MCHMTREIENTMYRNPLAMPETTAVHHPLGVVQQQRPSPQLDNGALSVRKPSSLLRRGWPRQVAGEPVTVKPRKRETLHVVGNNSDQALGIRFTEHRIFIGAKKTSKWSNMVDRLEMAFDGEPIDIPTVLGAWWECTVMTGVTATRIAPTNSLRVQLNGVFDIMATVVTMTEHDSRIHKYRVAEDDNLAHLDIGFKFYNLTGSLHGVLSQTYRSNYVNKLTVSTNMPVMSGGHNYISSDIFGTDCAVARFRRHTDISMLTSTTSTISQHGPSQ
uniref:Uncharacterized protein n=1 Tax=Aegilops tauschii TaxID=37682 RepID=M8CL16_AEGTA